MDNPFLNTDSGGDNPFLDSDKPKAKTSNPSVKEPKEKGVFGKTMDRIKEVAGTGVQIADIATGVLTMVPSWAEGLEAQAKGDSPTKAAEKAQAFREELQPGAQLRKAGVDLPTNPFLDKALEIADKAAEGVATAVGLSDMEFQWGAKPGPDMLKKREDPNYMATMIAKDAAGLGAGLRGAKKGQDFIDAHSKRIPDDPQALPPPPASSLEAPTPQLPAPKPGGPASSIVEQGQFAKQVDEGAMARYNQNPKDFGVDEGNVVNPFVPLPEQPLTLTGEEMPYDLRNPVEAAAVTEQTGLTYSARQFDKPEITHPDEGQFAFSPDPQKEVAWHKFLHEKSAEPTGGSALAEKIPLMDVLDYIQKHADDPMQRVLAGLLQDPIGISNTRITIRKANDDHPIYGNASVLSNEINLFWNPKDPAGLSPETILHEALHIQFLEMMEAGRDNQMREKYPVLARFSDELYDLWQAALKALPEEKKKWMTPFFGNIEKLRGSPGHEFISYGLTSPAFRRTLQNIRVSPDGKTAKYLPPDWEKDLDEKNWWTDQVNDKGTLIHDNYLVRMQNAVSKVLSVGKEHKYYYKADALKQEIDEYLKIQTLPKASVELMNLVFPILLARQGRHPGASLFDMFVEADDLTGLYTRSLTGKYFHGMFEVEGKTPIDLPPESRPPPKLSKKDSEVIYNLISPTSNYKELYKFYGEDFYNSKKDLNKLTANFYPTALVKNISRNPLAIFAVSKMREINGDTHVLKKVLVEQLKEFEKLPEKDQFQILTGLNEINRPEIQEVLQMERELQYGPKWFLDKKNRRLTSKELAYYGISPNLEEIYRQTLEPLFEATLRIDDKSIRLGFRRPGLLSKVVGYYPRSFGYGKFMLKAHDATGKMVYYRREPDFVSIKKLEADLRKQGHSTVRQTTKSYSDYKSHLLALIETDPGAVIAKVAQASINASEEYKRTQEFERNAKGVAGFVGQMTNNPRELQLLKQSIYHRIEQTAESYKSARLLEELLRPVQADARMALMQPRAVKWVFDLSRREMGGNISMLTGTDYAIQWAFEQAYTAYLKVFTNKAKDLAPKEIPLSPTAAQETGRYFTAGASAYTLAGNIPNLITNAWSIPLVSILGGIPDAALLKRPGRLLDVSARAQTQALLDIGFLLANKWAQAPQDVRDFLTKANDRGLLVANAFNDLPEMRANIEKGTAQKAFDAALNVPRRLFNDPVEWATNVHTLLFYNRFVEYLYPTLSKKEHFNLAVDLAKRYTADYARWNKAQMFDKAGIIGTGVSNFATWIGTRIGQMHEVSKRTLTDAQLTPLVALLAAQIIVAGLAGAPTAQDYANLQKATSQKLNLPPLDVVLKDNDVPEWLRNGVIMNSMGLDFASRGKWAGWTDLGGVTYTMPGKFIDIYDYIYGKMSEALPRDTGTDVTGPTRKETSEFVRALPFFMQGAAAQHLLARDNRGDGKQSFLSPYGRPFYTQTPDEKPFNIMGMKTTRQAEEQREFYNWLYKDNKDMKAMRALKAEALSQLLAAVDARKKGQDGRAATLEASAQYNLRKLMKINPDALNNILKDLEGAARKESETPEEKALRELAGSQSAGRIKTIIEQLQRTNKELVPKLGEPLTEAEKQHEKLVIEEDLLLDPKKSKDIPGDGYKNYPTLNMYPSFKARTFDDTRRPLNIAGVTDAHVNAPDVVWVSEAERKYKDRLDTLLHEAEHLGQKRLKTPKNNAEGLEYVVKAQWDANTGKHRSGLMFILAIREPEIAARLKELGVGITQDSALSEILADMGAFEQRMGPEYDLTKDPVLSRTLFRNKDTRETFRAMVGLRQTRLDSKDLTPHVRDKQPETPLLQRLFKLSR